MNQTTVVYSGRPLLSTRRGIANLTHAATLVSLIAIAVASVNLGPNRRWYLLLLTLYVALNTAATLRLLGTLKKIEARSNGEDEIALAIFDHAQSLPVLGLLALLAALSLVSL
jgi:hypothetical protein